MSTSRRIPRCRCGSTSARAMKRNRRWIRSPERKRRVIDTARETSPSGTRGCCERSARECALASVVRFSGVTSTGAGGRIQLQRAIVLSQLTTPKNHRRRRLDLSRRLRAELWLWLWRRRQRADWLAFGQPFPSGSSRRSRARRSTGRTYAKRSTASWMQPASIGAGRTRCATRSRRCCCPMACRSCTSLDNSAIAIRRSRCTSTRIGCGSVGRARGRSAGRCATGCNPGRNTTPIEPSGKRGKSL